MASFNKVILMGNLTRDPDIRVTPQGTSICKITIAVSRQTKTQDGSLREETAFVDVDAFGKQADVIAKFFAKGRPILIEGRLRLDQWETQSGEKRSKLGVVLESFQFVGPRGEDDFNHAMGISERQSSPVNELVEDLSKDGMRKSKPMNINVQMDEDVPF